MQFIINIQHDCRTSQCQPTGRRTVLQERKDTGETVPAIEHVDNDRFIVNMHAFHNAALIRAAVGRELSQPTRVTENRTRWLKDKAQLARSILIDKQAQAQAKAAETRAKNRNARAAAKDDSSAARARNDKPKIKRKRKRDVTQNGTVDNAEVEQEPLAKRLKRTQVTERCAAPVADRGQSAEASSGREKRSRLH